MNRRQYTPGPATGARVDRSGEEWTLVLVRELRHPPEKGVARPHRSGAAAGVGALRRRWQPRWHICFDVLDHLLDGDPLGRIVGPEVMKFSGWQRLNAEYATQFGIDDSAAWNQN